MQQSQPMSVESEKLRAAVAARAAVRFFATVRGFACQATGAFADAGVEYDDAGRAWVSPLSAEGVGPVGLARAVDLAIADRLPVDAEVTTPGSTSRLAFRTTFEARTADRVLMRLPWRVIEIERRRAGRHRVTEADGVFGGLYRGRGTRSPVRGARLWDVSAGGCAFTVPADRAGVHADPGELFTVELRRGEDAFTLPALMRHRRPGTEREMLVGMQFDPRDESASQAMFDAAAELIARLG